MKKADFHNPLYFTLGGFLFFVLPFFYMAYWMYCSSVYPNRSLAIEKYKELLPNFMRNTPSSNFIFLVFAVLALGLATKRLNHHKPPGYIISMTITILSAILIFLYVFQMI